MRLFSVEKTREIESLLRRLAAEKRRRAQPETDLIALADIMADLRVDGCTTLVINSRGFRQVARNQ